MVKLYKNSGRKLYKIIISRRLASQVKGFLKYIINCEDFIIIYFFLLWPYYDNKYYLKYKE